jgi:hypothetical protein
MNNEERIRATFQEKYVWEDNLDNIPIKELADFCDLLLSERDAQIQQLEGGCKYFREHLDSIQDAYAKALEEIQQLKEETTNYKKDAQVLFQEFEDALASAESRGTSQQQIADAIDHVIQAICKYEIPVQWVEYMRQVKFEYLSTFKERTHQLNYCIGKYWKDGEGRLCVYCYGSQVHYGNMADAVGLLEYVKKVEKSENYRIFELSLLPSPPSETFNQNDKA